MMVLNIVGNPPFVIFITQNYLLTCSGWEFIPPSSKIILIILAVNIFSTMAVQFWKGGICLICADLFECNQMLSCSEHNLRVQKRVRVPTSSQQIGFLGSFLNLLRPRLPAQEWVTTAAPFPGCQGISWKSPCKHSTWQRREHCTTVSCCYFHYVEFLPIKITGGL